MPSLIESILEDYPGEYTRSLLVLAIEELTKNYGREWDAMAYINQVGAVLCWSDGYLYGSRRENWGRK